MNLYQIYGVKIASNPNARNHDRRDPLISKRFGNRSFRRRMAALVRAHGINPVLSGLAA